MGRFRARNPPEGPAGGIDLPIAPMNDSVNGPGCCGRRFEVPLMSD